MPRKKTSKKTSTNKNNNQQVNDFDFSKVMDNSATSILSSIATEFWRNPLWANEVLKSAQGKPIKYKRDDIIKLINSPQENEIALRHMALYFDSTNLFYKRVKDYLASLLVYNYYLIPENVTKEEVNSPSFKRAYKKVISLLNKINMEKDFLDIMKVVLNEDAGFYYLREDNDKIVLQRLPSDWCKIVNKTELGYQFAFNMVYFLRPGVDIEDYPPEFKLYLEEFMQGDTNVSYFWKTLPPDKAFCFKFNENDPTIIPPLIGLFLDLLEIVEYKELIKSKTMLDAVQILIQKIPMRDGKDSKNVNDFLIDAKTATTYHQAVKNNLPDNGNGIIKLVTTPMPIDSIEFNKTDNKDSVVGYAESSFYKTAGISQLLFNSDQSGSIGLNASIKTDEMFVVHMFRQFERFLNFLINQVSGKYTFKLHFPDLTYTNRAEKADLFLKGAQFGYPKSLFACAVGINQSELDSLSNFEDFIGMNNLTPLQSSHTLPSNNTGRPPKDEGQLSDRGLVLKDINDNQNRAQ